ncbi:MAG TPA: leucyl aminopeptidase family protein [Rhizomicrobium sp.]|jgi:leucyl aminopeptidase|nr:leucyl aminopeptidase family protein [Rhizomicrobium sp.]
MHPGLASGVAAAIPLHAVTARDARAWLAKDKQRRLLSAAGFTGAGGQLMALPNARGAIRAWALGLGDGRDAFALALAASSLPAGTYRLGDVPDFCAGAHAALAWIMGGYVFDRYKKKTRTAARLVIPQGVNGAEISRIARHLFLARDLVNTPANDMGPAELEGAARALARSHDARVSVVSGAALGRDYPLVAAVGAGSPRSPRLIELVWGRADAPRVTLVGKGVCFDSGGLDIKPSAGMLTMKKDMGGAACALAVAGMAMDAKLDMRLRVLIPAVENSVSGTAMRPGDIFKSRKGLTVEIGNTDAEGRLILADALADADDEKPDLLIDIATLTGAARSATGMEVPPFFTDDERLAGDLMRLGAEVHDPLWRLPLWRGYEDTLSSRVADLNNNPNYGYAGAITAALFLNRFVEKARSWVHLDIPAWIDRPRPGRPIGGEANAARALYALLKERYGRQK